MLTERERRKRTEADCWGIFYSGRERKYTPALRLRVITMLYSQDPDIPNNILPERCRNAIILLMGQPF